MNILSFEYKRKEKINQYLVMFQIAFHFIVIIWYLQFKSADFASMDSFHALMVLSFLGLLTLVFLGRIKPDASKKVLLTEIFIVTVYILTVLFLVYLINSFVTRTLFFVPMVIVIIKHGKKIGLIITAIVILAFFILELFLGAIPYNIEDLLIFSSISLLIIWLIGNLLETEEKMRRSLIEIAHRDKCILENNDAGIIYIDNESIVRIFNAAAEKLLDMSKDDVLEKTIDCVKESYLTDIYCRSDGDSLNHESIFIKDYNLINISLIYDDKEEYLGKLIMIKDLSQTNILHTLKQKVDFITESINMPLITIDASGRVTFLNNEACEFFAINKSKALLRHYKNTFCCNFSDYIEKTLKLPENVLNDEITLTCNVEKTPREVLISVGITKDIQKNIQGVTFLINDVTELRHRDRQFMQADKLAALGEVAAGVAHEIRNPLTTIKGVAQLLLRRVDPGNIDDTLRLIVEESDRANSIISDFLAFARPSEPVFSPKPLRQVFNEIYHLIEAHCLLNKTKLVLQHVDSQNPTVNWDDKQIKQVFLNLTLNSLKAMAEVPSKRIEMSISQKKDAIIVNFKDNGIGIEEDIIKDIFNPFFTTNHDGTGLGLSISYKIIERHKGKVSIESKKDEGTTFVVELPINPN
ncbi:ATP-binding protein [Desulfitibacter alkalitolerans]|uniref:ATP-binding protein n=1 Tax=Desulfitibacter alkalitolerans TaxID=264641 RepID=UPI0006840DE1|nr:ATP-binding protein [Desulfitibacter alkalitolerans]